MNHIKIILSEKDIKRFWEKVNTKSDEECWEWMTYKNKDGYGRVRINRKVYLAHRVSWVIHNGGIIDGLLVCHTCDNPGCVNPSHLFLGTNLDNMRDRDKKERGVNPIGEEHGRHKLTEKEVAEIREKYIPYTYSTRKLAKEFNVSQTTIRYIITRKGWTHLEEINENGE